MTKVALNGSKIVQSTRINYVSYTQQVWNPWKYPPSIDPETGLPIGDYTGGWDYFSRNADAIIDGTVSSSSHVRINSVSITVNGDSTNETWVNAGLTAIAINITPAENGSGSGKVENSSSHVKINGVSIALIGTSVTTHLSTSTTIADGATHVNVSFIGPGGDKIAHS